MTYLAEIYAFPPENPFDCKCYINRLIDIKWALPTKFQGTWGQMFRSFLSNYAANSSIKQFIFFLKYFFNTQSSDEFKVHLPWASSVENVIKFVW